ncbi:BZ3500_MvSof-1268-A1-R1_Chr1-3g02045 [Microbotryum saponariae]|uniref:BZ3500_MvSof-1268-A1-R1_Chr1-3g02045 protein n=1 Tax=Microbotryum saponariae TaxID=289078 RepID=A0A2X0KCC5_9BASI|nr:BZ3500_MvSof-1268-A1-R1_Chr1-3g02045 [Microbotryum saponariae]SCZ95246.1 BZ3501_MvSof-1269-A2-R1_Chr1-3g01647 [Microbotryum saponariae]
MQGPGGSLTPAPSPPPPGGASRSSRRMTSTTPSKVTHTRNISGTLDSDHLDSSDGLDDEDDAVGAGGESVVFDDEEEEADYRSKTTGSRSRRETVVDDEAGMDEDYVVDDEEEVGSGSESPKPSRFSPLQSHTHAPDRPESSKNVSGGFPSRFGFGSSSNHNRSSRAHAEGGDARRSAHRSGGRGGPGGGSRPAGGRNDQWTERILDRNGYPRQLTFDPFLEADAPQHAASASQEAPSTSEPPASQPIAADPSTESVEPVTSASTSS